jgi:hypothetical protein
VTVTIRTTSGTPASNTATTYSALCLSTESVIAGGYSLTDLNNGTVTANYPDVVNKKWTIVVRNSQNNLTTVYAVCKG